MTEVLLWLETHQMPRHQGEADQVASRGQEEEEEEEEVVVRFRVAGLFHHPKRNKMGIMRFRVQWPKDAHAGSRTRVTCMGGLYDAATLHALWFHQLAFDY